MGIVVAQSMGGVFAVIGTPTQPPKSRGKSTGWPTGQPRRRKIRRLLKKVQLDPKNNTQSLLDSLTFIF